MNTYALTYELITQLTQSTELKRFQADRKIAAAKLSLEERQREQVSRDIDNVTAVADAAKEFQFLMDEVNNTFAADVRKQKVAA